MLVAVIEISWLRTDETGHVFDTGVSGVDSRNTTTEEGSLSSPAVRFFLDLCL